MRSLIVLPEFVLKPLQSCGSPLRLGAGAGAIKPAPSGRAKLLNKEVFPA